MTKRLPFTAGFAAGTALLALLAAPAGAQSLDEPVIRRPTLPPAAPARPVLAPPAAAPVGALLAPPPDTSAVAMPSVLGADSVSPANFVGPLLPVVAPPVAAVPTVDTLAQARNRQIGARLAAMQREVPLVYNPYVRGYIDYFTIRNPKYTRRMLERQHLYFALFERKLAQYGMPSELKYLSVVESALNTKAASHAKAVGLWQFIPQAAQDYHLAINSWKDERCDPEKATDAACRYLRNLNRAFNGNWELALAAYNCGPGNVRRAIRKAGGQANFWAIFPYLPQETRGYVPSLTAVIYAMNHAADYGIVPENVLLPITTDTVHVDGPFDVAKLAETLGLESQLLHDLNPELRKPLLPAVAKAYALKIPADKRLAFDALSRAELYATCRPLPAAAGALALDSATLANKPVLKASRYVVRRGETLNRVAAKNGCSVAQLRTWNKLHGRATLQAGQRLVVWHATKPARPLAAPAPGGTTAATALAAAPAPKPDSAGALAAAPATKVPAVTAAPVVPNRADIDPQVAAAAPATPNAPLAAVAALTRAQLDSARATGYTVQSGDNLYQIARVFGVSVKKLTEWNALAAGQVQRGQTLVVRGAAADPAEEPATLAATAVPPGGELAGSEYVTAPQSTAKAVKARELAHQRARWTATQRARVQAVHLVQPGDTLWDISRKRNVSVEQIRKLNRLKTDALQPGQRIVLS